MWIVCCCVASDTEPADLTVRAVTHSVIVDDRTIVGRAVCGSTTWLLTETPSLVDISTAAPRASVRQVRGLRAGEQPWGLACLANGSLWTLAAAHVLARLTTDARVVERIRLELPRLALFGAGDRLLFEELPVLVGSPVLSTSPPRKPMELRRWPGLLGRAAAARPDLLVVNLLNCGIGADGFVPCWFADQSRIAISDGSAAQTISMELQFPPLSTVDSTAPIRDVALAGTNRVWVLSTSREGYGGRRTGGRLTKSNRRAEDEARVDLKPPARLIVGATERACFLLSVRGELVEVSDR